MMSTLTATAALLLPSEFKPNLNSSLFLQTRITKKRNQALVPVARLFGPAIFESSKLNVLFLGVDEKKHPGNLPRTYTLTHSDLTSKLTLAISQTINNPQLQGWYSKLQRDEVVAEWRKVKGKMSLHVHCHISGGHFLLDLFSRLRYFIFCKELPVVLKAFIHGDVNLFNSHPELEEALVWVYFHSSTPQFNKVECWGQLRDATSPSDRKAASSSKQEDLLPQPCQEEECSCCFPRLSSSSPWPQELRQPNETEPFQGQTQKHN